MKLKGSVEHIDMPVPMVSLVHNDGTSGSSLVATLDLSRFDDVVIRMWEFGPIHVKLLAPRMIRDPRTLAPRSGRAARPEPPTKPLPPRGTCRSCGRFTPGFVCAVCAMKGPKARP